MLSGAQLARFLLAVFYSGMFWLGVSFFMERRQSGWFSLKVVAILWLLVFGTLFYGVVVHGPNWAGPEWLRLSMGRLIHSLR